MNMPLFKCWIHLESLDIDIAHIYPANNIQEAIQIAQNYANSLNGKLKTVDNIYTGIPSSSKPKIPKR
jgi:hypothetical protein